MSTSPDQQPRDELMDRLYTQYGKPLEKDHWGEFLAVTEDGRTLLAGSRREAAMNAADEFGRGIFLFKVGDVAVGRIR